MIEFFNKSELALSFSKKYTDWIITILEIEKKTVGELTFIYCHDNFLLSMNQEYLGHDYYTDVITFDYSKEDLIEGDVFISVDRVRENAQDYGVSFETELRRIMAHGVMHLVGYKDKTKQDKEVMTSKEDWALNLFHVER